jgi:cytochrome c-type biogenesis protein
MGPQDALFLMPAAFIAGLLMFLAPCTLPIVPGYLAFISGVRVGDNRIQKNVRRRLMLNACAFVLGFSIIFILLGLFAAGIGSLLGPWRDIIARASGAVVVLFGLTMLGVVRVPYLSGERHIAAPKWLTLGRWESSLFIGMLFAFGWSPCIGPILGTVLLFASSAGTKLDGALLLAVFSAGLGLPFILTAYFMSAVSGLVSRTAGAVRVLSSVGAVMLIVLGALMISGDMGLLVAWAFSALDAVHYSSLLQYM